MDERTAYARLLELGPLHQLKIVTSIPDPAGAGRPESDPRHFVLHLVTHIEAAQSRGEVDFVIGRSAEGSWIKGKPAAVLRKTTEWARAEAQDRVDQPWLYLPGGGSVLINAAQAGASGAAQPAEGERPAP